MVNSTSVNVGRRQPTRGQAVPAEGKVSLRPEGFAPRSRIFLGQSRWSTDLAQDLGQGAGMGPAVCPMVCWRNAERVRERRGQACEILAQEQGGVSLGGRKRRASDSYVCRASS